MELFSLYRHLLQSAGDSIFWRDCQKLKKHLIKAAQCNGLQRNNFGMNPVIRDLQTAVIVAEEIGMKGSCLIGIMLHEIVKGHVLSIDEVNAEYGEDVASIIKGLVKTNELYAKSPAIESENFRNLLLSFAEDMRVILIMIADRVNVMRKIKDTGNEEDRIKVANEAAYLYAPLAHKLGLYKLKSELEDYDNGNLTVTEVTSRFGLSVFFLIFNLIVSAFAIMLTGSMLLSQILFIISAMFLPVSLLISMIPAFSGTSRRAVISLFNTIMLRVGTTLLTTFVLVLSSLAYTIANGKPFVVVVLLQVIVFAGVYMKRNKLLGMIGLRDEGTGRVGRAMTNRPRRTISRAVRKALPFAAGVGVGKRSAQRRAMQSTQRTASTSASRETVQPKKKNLGQRVGETAGKIADTPSRVRDKAVETVQKVKDAPTNAEYAVRSNVESARESVRETMQKRREARAAQMESRRTTTASCREQLSQRKRERNEGNTEKPRTESTRVAPKERPTVPKQQKTEPEKPSAPQNRPRSERIEPTPRQREDRPTVKDKPQTTVADRKPDRPAERPMVPDKPKTRYTMPKGLDEETFGVEFKQRKTGEITRKTAAFGEPR